MKEEIIGHRPKCDCPCHIPGMVVMHCFPCCDHCYEKYPLKEESTEQLDSKSKPRSEADEDNEV